MPSSIGNAAVQVKGWQKAVLLATFALWKITSKPRKSLQKSPYVHLQYFVIVVEETVQKEEHLLIYQPDFYKQQLWPVQELMNHINS